MSEAEKKSSNTNAKFIQEIRRGDKEIDEIKPIVNYCTMPAELKSDAIELLKQNESPFFVALNEYSQIRLSNPKPSDYSIYNYDRFISAFLEKYQPNVLDTYVSLKNNNRIELNIERLEDIIQMDDDIVIIATDDEIKLINIKEKDFEIIQTLKI